MMMEGKNRCPFLKEQKVAFCKAFPLRKLLPFDRLYPDENICVTRQYTQCPTYREKMKGETSARSCPFLEIETVIYCEVFPIKKMIPSSCYKLECPCTTNRYTECPIYQKMIHGDLPPEEEVRKVWEFILKSAYYYHRGHTWMKESGERVRIGLDDFGQFIIGPIEKLTLPRIGEKVRKERPFVEITSSGGNVRILSPLSGTVIALNEEVIREPGLINVDPYERGWLLEVIPDEAEALRGRGILHGQEAEGWLQKESEELQQLLQSEIGLTMADGGDLLKDLPRGIGTTRWRSLVKIFIERKEG